jgi:hypothetical protein
MMKPYIILTTYKEKFRMFTKDPPQKFPGYWSTYQLYKVFFSVRWITNLCIQLLSLTAFLMSNLYSIQCNEQLTNWKRHSGWCGIFDMHYLMICLEERRKNSYNIQEFLSKSRNKPGHSRIQSMYANQSTTTFGPRM